MLSLFLRCQCLGHIYKLLGFANFWARLYDEEIWLWWMVSLIKCTSVNIWLSKREKKGGGKQLLLSHWNKIKHDKWYILVPTSLSFMLSLGSFRIEHRLFTEKCKKKTQSQQCPEKKGACTRSFCLVLTMRLSTSLHRARNKNVTCPRQVEIHVSVLLVMPPTQLTVRFTKCVSPCTAQENYTETTVSWRPVNISPVTLNK